MRASSAATSGEFCTARAAESATRPNSTPATVIAAVQPRATGRTRRTVRPVTLPSSPVPGLARDRSGSGLAPRSRRPARYTVADVMTMTQPSAGSSASGRSPVNGRSCSGQPSGVSQRSQPCPDPASATARTAYAAASAAPARAAACLRVGAICPASVPTSRNTAALITDASASAAASPGLKPTREERPASPTTTPGSAQSRNNPLPTPSSASAQAWRRVVRPASSSSQRPASSSPRSNLVPHSRPHTAPTRLRIPTARHCVNPATVSMPRAGPNSALNPAFDPSPATRACRSAAVLYVVAYPSAETAR